MSYVFPPAPVVSVPVVGCGERFPVHRIYCVGRNYEEHAKEMGFTGREPPFFFLKPADAIVVVNAGETGQLPYPSLTANLHHEIELVVAIGKGGKNIQAADAFSHIYGYAVGLDMTRRDLQNDMKKQGRPWCIGKGFDASAPIGPITPAAQAGDVAPEVARIKRSTDLPIIVGFGITTPEAARTIASVADGCVVGSAIVKDIGAGVPVAQVLARVKALADGAHSA